jgi:predicted nuclease of restriction endonuclease-like (RecB) superfamily
MKTNKPSSLFRRVSEIISSARNFSARSVNTAQVAANWSVGREIFEEEQKGQKRAAYGEELLEDLSRRLKRDFGNGYSVRNLAYCRNFYCEYPQLMEGLILNAVRAKFPPDALAGVKAIPHALRSESAGRKSGALAALGSGAEPAQIMSTEIHPDAAALPWEPGQLHPNLSWTHYRTLLRVERPEARAFYEIEAIQQNWSARELERQINSLLFERLAKSRDKAGLRKLATKGQEIQSPADVFKDPVVIEFLGLPESARLVESKLEEALISNLQAFLLELGKGFAFIARQQRLTLDGDHFYIDLVFYHTVLKCHVLIDLKVGKLTHQDLGQLQLYVNYYDRERRTAGDQPTLGLILCTDKNDTAVRYTLAADQKKIFTSRYKLHLPTEAELQAELRRELRDIQRP